jgi:ComF family protein
VRLLEGLIEFAFPTRCAGCDLPGTLLCPACGERLALIDPERACPRCGAPEGTARCGECGGAAFGFAAARCAGVFEGPLARMIVLHKDLGERRLVVVLATLIVGALPDWAGWPEAVVGVPASPAAVCRRGFDHGAALSEEVARLGGWPHLHALRCGARLDQRGLSRERRAANVAAALSIRAGVEVPPRVLLVDDVLTTGATLDAATRVLLAAGAAEVRVAVVARACES